MTRYQLYGLNVASAFQMDVEACSAGPSSVVQPDITIRNEPVDLPEMRRGRIAGTLYHVSNDTIYLHWDNLGSFRIHAGCDISAMRAPAAPDKLFLRTLTGSILSIALYQRGRFILHASAVAVDEGAVAFAGDSGYGKSTIASSLHASGHHLLADDIAVIQVGETTHHICPGNQEFKLWPDSVRNLGQEVDNLDRINPDLEKRLLPVAGGLQREPVPLKSIYILDFADKEGIDLLEPAQAAIELVRNTYGVTLLHELRTADYFRQVVRLAQSVPVCRLRRGKSLEHFDRFLAMVKDHLASRL